MDKIILFEDGSWEWEPLATIKLNSTKMKFIVLTIGITECTSSWIQKSQEWLEITTMKVIYRGYLINRNL